MVFVRPMYLHFGVRCQKLLTNAFEVRMQVLNNDEGCVIMFREAPKNAFQDVEATCGSSDCYYEKVLFSHSQSSNNLGAESAKYLFIFISGLSTGQVGHAKRITIA